MPETTSTAAERELRRVAAEPVYRRLAADSQRVPALAPFLATMEERLFDHAFNISALWRAHDIDCRRGASERFGPLGSSPSVYLTHCRLSVAARLLAHTGLRIPRIRELCGYASPAPFSKAFKKWSGGRKPSEYRKNPDPDPEPWRPGIDLSKVHAALGAPMARKERLELCHHLLDVSESDVSELLDLADAALATADYEAALRLLELAAKRPDRDAYQAAIDGRIALAAHCRGTVLTVEGDVDRAYGDMGLARACYAQAGVLERDLEKRRRRVESQVSCRTDNALAAALCTDCRRALVLDVGESLRRHLHRALEPVPLDLPWFGVCCDGCYRVVWDAFKLARHGLLNDAYRAFWLATHVDLGDSAAPASVGRVMAALAEVDSFGWASQEDRLKMCDVALSAAETLRQPELLLVARFWRGNVLRALSRFTDARKELNWQGKAVENTWIRALHDRFLGIVEQYTKNTQEAMGLLGHAAGLYQRLDPHIAGLLLNQQGVVECFNRRDFPAAIRSYRQAVPFFDVRRDSRPLRADLPINLAVALARLGDLEQAIAELSHCHYDRSAYPAIAAAEVFTRGCIHLLARRAHKALECFAAARHRFEALGQLVDVALTSTYSVEAHCLLGDHAAAVEAAAVACRLLNAAGCPVDTLEAAAQIRALVAEEVVPTEVVAGVRKLAAKCGGWLPADDHLPEGG